MMNGLVGVLSRFRKEETAVTCDIGTDVPQFLCQPRTQRLSKISVV